MKAKVYLIDDQPNEAKRLKRILESSGTLDINLKQPSPDIGSVVLPVADLYLVDYELDKQQGDRHITYKGSTLVTAIREKAPDYPVVLITRDSILDSRHKEELQDELRIDDIIYKGEIATDESSHFANRLIMLVSGFEVLRNIPSAKRDWPALLGAIKAYPSASDLILRATPPLYQDRGTPEWSVSRMAWWIRNMLLAYPGILYDPVYAGTELRISVESFLSPEVQELFAEARYQGVFDPRDGRWWRELLWQKAMEYVEDTDFAGKFSDVFHKQTGIELEPATSIVRGEKPADAVCWILHQPAMYKYTVAYRPDTRPPVMDPARVSFTAIQQHYDQIQRGFLEGVDDELLRRIQEMEL